MQAVRKEVCGETNWDTRIKGAEEHAKTTVVIWRYGASIQVHHKRAGVQRGGGKGRRGKRARKKETDSRDRREEKREERRRVWEGRTRMSKVVQYGTISL